VCVCVRACACVRVCACVRAHVCLYAFFWCVCVRGILFGDETDDDGQVRVACILSSSVGFGTY